MTTTTETPSNLGPLTTTFTPSPGCFTERWFSHTSNTAILSWGYACGLYNSSIPEIQPASSCWPENYNKVLDYALGRSLSSEAVNINMVFSPGNICPSGWTAAYNSTYGQGAGTYNVGANSVTMQTGDILTACCPLGYALGNTDCAIETIQLGERLSLGYADNGSCTTGTIKTFHETIGSSSDMVATLNADPIFLIENTAISATDSAGTSVSDSSTRSGSSTALSTGAKIAIGVCTPAGILIIAAALFIYWHRRKKSKATENSTTEDLVSELPSSGIRAGELSASDPKYGVSELHSNRKPLELSGEGLLELPGDLGASSNKQ